MARWTAARIPDQSGRTAVVTGGNSGIGYCTAMELARHGARVILACRSAKRGGAALSQIRAAVPDAEVELAVLDLADLSSVRSFADTCPSDGLDLLINNAGVMALPRRTTADGFEMQFGVNHLGHFALTGLLLPRLLARPGARVINVSSAAHLLGTIDLGDLNSERGYQRWTVYGRSKTANLLFTHELARRVRASGAELTAAAAHPGYASTNLHAAGPKMEGKPGKARMMDMASRVLAQSAHAGALPILYAATAPQVRPDAFIGTRIPFWRGAPAPSRRAPWTLDDTAGELLWSASEQLTSVHYEALGN